jgi:hypothetical protein
MDKIKATVQILFMTQEIGTVELEPWENANKDKHNIGLYQKENPIPTKKQKQTSNTNYITLYIYIYYTFIHLHVTFSN